MTFIDLFKFMIPGLPPRTIPVQIEVVGCPLKFQVNNAVDKTSKIYFGAHMESNFVKTRNLKINNLSCCGE